MTTSTARGNAERDLVVVAVRAGKLDVNNLTNMVFYARHPELTGRSIGASQPHLAREWLVIRDQVVRPVVRSITGARAAAAPVASTRRTTSWLRTAWAGYRCAERGMVWVRILGRRTPVNPLTRAAFAALEHALRSTGYRASSVWNYNCREIKGQPGSTSLHAYGLAVDIDPDCNPHRRGARGPARFSSAVTQQQRCQDVLAGWADTAFTPEQVAAAEAIRTLDGLQVFAWGGRWTTSPDPMHFQINVSPTELARGIAG